MSMQVKQVLASRCRLPLAEILQHVRKIKDENHCVDKDDIANWWCEFLVL